MISTYTQLCPVVFGVGAVKQIGEKVKEFGCKKAFCIYDKGVKMTGMADAIIKLLNEAGVGTAVFEDVAADPTNVVVDQAGQAARDNKADIIIGIGGGSSLDTAKCAAVLNDNPLPITQYWASVNGKFEKKTPLILIPTASGTGSEVTVMAAIVDIQTHAKEAILRHANIAVVDPELTVTVPPHVTAATGIDALSHAIECYTTNCGNPKADVLALAAMELIVNNLEKAYKDGKDLEARTNMSLASNLAGIAFSDASVHFGHAAAHEMGSVFHMPHGVACAITLPEVIIFSSDVIPERIINIAKALNVALPVGATGVDAGEMAAAKVRELMRAVGIKSLKEQGISREAAVACAKGAVEKNWFIVCALKEINERVMAELIGKMYDNY